MELHKVTFRYLPAIVEFNYFGNTTPTCLHRLTSTPPSQAHSTPPTFIAITSDRLLVILTAFPRACCLSRLWKVRGAGRQARSRASHGKLFHIQPRLPARCFWIINHVTAAGSHRAPLTSDSESDTDAPSQPATRQMYLYLLPKTQRLSGHGQRCFGHRLPDYSGILISIKPKQD